MVAASNVRSFDARAIAPEQRIAIGGVPWKTYVLLRDAIDEPRLKMSYCEGVLELMSPSEEHELKKKLLARLLELYAFIARVPIVGYGSTTFRQQARERGAEPDECWLVGPQPRRGSVPDIVLEVIETSPLLDKLSLYDGLGIPEVWLFEAGKLSIYRRRSKGGYTKTRRSTFLAKLDPRLLERYAARTDHDAALHEFAARVGKRPIRRSRAR